MFQYHLCSLLFAVGAGIAGLMTSYYIGSSAGASITLYLAGIFLVILPAAKAGMNSQEKSAVRHLFRCRGGASALLYGNSAEPRSPPLLPQLQQLPGRPAAEQAYQCPCDHIAGVVDPHIQRDRPMHTASTSPVHLIHLLGSVRHQADAARKGSTGMP